MQRKYTNLFLFIAICLSVGWIGSVTTGTSGETWYAALQKPAFNPPNWIFAPVWTALYILMAIAGWCLWGSETSNRNRLRFLFAIQLVLNGVWSFLFFGLRNPLAGLVDILLLWICLLVLTKSAWRNQQTTGLLLTPYFIWVSFATYLNAAIWWFNR